MVKLILPQGAAALIAENLALRRQLIIHRRQYHRAPHLTSWDLLVFAFLGSVIKSERLVKSAILVKPSTIIKLHKAFVKRKYHLFFTSKPYQKPGPKGPSQELIDLIVEMKKRNPRFGCPRIAMQIKNAFGIDINKDVVRRVLEKYYKSYPNDDGPSWLTFLGHMKDSLWSVDLFRCESIRVLSKLPIICQNFPLLVRKENLLDEMGNHQGAGYRVI